MFKEYEGMAPAVKDCFEHVQNVDLCTAARGRRAGQLAGK
jgi:hypothetical protein